MVHDVPRNLYDAHRRVSTRTEANLPNYPVFMAFKNADGSVPVLDVSDFLGIPHLFECCLLLILVDCRSYRMLLSLIDAFIDQTLGIFCV